MVKMLAFASATAVLLLASTAADAVRVDPRVHRTLRQQDSVNLIITMNDGIESVISRTQESSEPDRGIKIAKMVASLERFTRGAQRPVSTLLSQEAASDTTLFKSWRPFFITNQVHVEGATGALLEKLLTMPNVKDIAEEEIYPVPELLISEPVVNTTTTSPTNIAVDWGVQKIGAPDVWAAGNRGENVVVGLVDTGVRGTHETVRSNHRAEFGWFDPEAKSATPYDPRGHGTGVLSALVGANGVGVAPGATWMACKICRATGGCPQSDVLACLQFMLCPTDPTGQTKDCSKAPHIVNNSWGGQRLDRTLMPAIEAWRAAGIIPVFANGNFGPFCETVYYPAGFPNVLGIGATDQNDTLKLISSKGPSQVDGAIKPDFIAPGSDIRCAWSDSDTQYQVFSATSLAAPHVSGSIALLLSAHPGLTFDQVKSWLANTTQKELPKSDEECGDPITPDTTFPNNQFGYGRIDIRKATSPLQ